MTYFKTLDLSPQVLIPRLYPSCSINLGGISFTVEKYFVYIRNPDTDTTKSLDISINLKSLKDKEYSSLEYSFISGVSSLTLNLGNYTKKYDDIGLGSVHPISLRVLECWEKLNYTDFLSLLRLIFKSDESGGIPYERNFNFALKNLGIKAIIPSKHLEYISSLYKDTIDNIKLDSNHSTYVCTSDNKLKSFENNHICDRSSSIYILLKIIRNNETFYTVPNTDYLLSETPYSEDILHSVFIKRNSYMINGPSSPGCDSNPLVMLVFWTLAFHRWNYDLLSSSKLMFKLYKLSIKDLIERLYNYSLLDHADFTKFVNEKSSTIFNVEAEYLPNEHSLGENLKFLSNVVKSLNLDICLTCMKRKTLFGRPMEHRGCQTSDFDLLICYLVVLRGNWWGNETKGRGCVSIGGSEIFVKFKSGDHLSLPNGTSYFGYVRGQFSYYVEMIISNMPDIIKSHICDESSSDESSSDESYSDYY